MNPTKKGIGDGRKSGRKRRGVGVDQMIAGPGFRIGGKSELHRAGWSLTATGGDPKESATENIPPLPKGRGKGEKAR
jgi:hypothetical protein